jgi:hypothetical protein
MVRLLLLRFKVAHNFAEDVVRCSSEVNEIK